MDAKYLCDYFLLQKMEKVTLYRYEKKRGIFYFKGRKLLLPLATIFLTCI